MPPPTSDWERLLSTAASGSLDGIETGVRQLIRTEPLETEVIERFGVAITVPTAPEMLRIKGVLILRRNATRDYVDFAALADRLGEEIASAALPSFDRLYPQESGESAFQQLQAQLASALPYDLEDTDLSEYRSLASRWQDWGNVQETCIRIAVAAFDAAAGAGDRWPVGLSRAVPMGRCQLRSETTGAVSVPETSTIRF